MCGAIEKAGVNSVLEGDLLENKRSHIRSMETPVETSLRSELYMYYILHNIPRRQQPMVEINFLCVHKKLRSKRVAPVLIKEITRRVNLEGIFQAVYTAGVLLPKPISVCQYWHRSLNPKKLVEVHFSALHKHMTLQRMIKLYRLPEVCSCVLDGGGGD